MASPSYLSVLCFDTLVDVKAMYWNVYRLWNI